MNNVSLTWAENAGKGHKILCQIGIRVIAMYVLAQIHPSLNDTEYGFIKCMIPYIKTGYIDMSMGISLTYAPREGYLVAMY